MNLANISIKRPVFATMVLALLIVLGIVSYGRMNVDEMPDASEPYVSISVTYEGAQPEQVDAQVTQKIEEAVGEAQGVKHITSTSSEGSAIIGVSFDLSIDGARATQDVRDKISAIRDELPTGIQEPVISKFDMKAAPVVTLAFTSDSMSRRQMSAYIKDVLKPRLQKIPGVGQLKIAGLEEREIHLLLNQNDLNTFGLSPADVASRLEQVDQNIPGGKLKGRESHNQGKELSIQTEGNFTSIREFLSTAIASRGGVPINYGQIGTVKDTVKELETLARYDGKEAIGVEVGKQSGANAVKVGNAVKAELAQLARDLPRGMECSIVRDDARTVSESIDEVWFDLIVGGLVAVLIIFAFLGDWRGTFISALAIPASIIAAFFFMHFANFSINSMSLMGLSLSVGLLIDDAIVVIENISRHKAMGKSPKKAAIDGTTEISLAVLATTLAVVAVFLPVGFISGTVGQYFKEFGLSIVFAVLISLFISFTLTPMLAAIYLPIRQGGSGNTQWDAWWRKGDRAFNHLAQRYSLWLSDLLLTGRKRVLLISLALLAASLGIWSSLGSSFSPVTDKAQFQVTVRSQSGITLNRLDQQAEKISGAIQSFAEVDHVYANISQTEQVYFVKLVPKKQRAFTQKEMAGQLRDKLNAIPGVRADIQEGDGKPVELSITGPSMDTLKDASTLLAKEMEKIPGTRDVQSTYRSGTPNLSLHLNESRARDLSVSAGKLGTTMQTLLSGAKVGKYSDGEDRVDVRLKLQDLDRSNTNMLTSVFVPTDKTTATGETMLVPLSQIASWNYSTGASDIRRYDRQKEIRLTANLEGTSLGQYQQAFDESFDPGRLPAGVKIGGAGEAEDMDEGFSSIFLALILAVTFIFMVLASQFESYTEPFTIMLALPLALIGALVALFITDSDLSIVSLIGIMMLMGLVTKNSILLIDFTKQRIQEGQTCHDALVEASHVRLRPILMTTLAMIGGMLPISLGLGPGSEARAPMAHAIIGGLITSTLLTLVVVPVAYSLIDEWKRRKEAKDNSSLL